MAKLLKIIHLPNLGKNVVQSSKWKKAMASKFATNKPYAPAMEIMNGVCDAMERDIMRKKL